MCAAVCPKTSKGDPLLVPGFRESSKNFEGMTPQLLVSSVSFHGRNWNLIIGLSDSPFWRLVSHYKTLSPKGGSLHNHEKKRRRSSLAIRFHLKVGS